MIIYQHYKGGLYKFIGIAIHTETSEKLVIYQNEEEQIFARPYEMFFGKVEYQGEVISRFKEIK